MKQKDASPNVLVVLLTAGFLWALLEGGVNYIGLHVTLAVAALVLS